ncbi:quaternary amine ABC transporter ATP-binding protein [Propylenella binzhouense]|uniref:Quaternary amine transport ATP-binding protein n=1 Tax=Propylenella binzhouense TaxID=2555902 RepID=A0A964WUW4_9HYPH|nr:glycine betaine/L-proline ABC transporter ATP-binding protein [Propylenella binzhouense]MYZ49506.1 glycine betaine/L-proline ABC transporter ATP-binding protein [Propylenella binzhouense]
MQAKLRARHIFKVFGDAPQDALERLGRGESKTEIFAETGQTVGVQDVSFDVPEGHIFVVMGLSGSGKSTLVRMLNGLIAPTSGEILIDGEDVAKCGAERLRAVRRDKIAMVFQHFALFPHMSVAENAAYGLKIKGVGPAERREKAVEALGQVGLAAYADSHPQDLSGGMQQRVGLARALATDPQILLMDEPFGALDPLIRREMQDELLRLQKTLKKTIIFITHDLNEALLLGDEIAIMKDGRFVQVGTAQEIVSAPADDYVSAFVADIDRGRVFTAEHVAAEPAAIQLGGASAEAALQSMEEQNRNALYVLDGDRIAGVVTYQNLAAAARDSDTSVSDVLITDFPAVEGDAQLNQIYGAASAGLPIAVTDGENRLVGIVEPEAVFAQLSGEEKPAEEGRR